MDNRYLSHGDGAENGSYEVGRINDDFRQGIPS